MKKQSFHHLIMLSFANLIMSFIALFIYKMFRYNLKLDIFIQWMQDYTKRFALYFLILFIVFFLTSKIQIKIVEKLKLKYNRVPIILKYLMIFTILLTASIVVNYYFQYFENLKNPILTNQWIGEKTNAFFVGVLYLLIIYLFIFVLAGNIYLSTLVTSIFLLLIGFIHYNKLNLRGEPLYPDDYKQFGQLKDVIPMVKEYLSVHQIIWVCLIFLCIGAAIFFLPKVKISIRMRALILIFSLPFLYGFTYFPASFMNSFLQKNGVQMEKWNQLFNYQSNGFLFGFVSNIYGGGFEKPEGYSKQRVLDIAKKYAKSSDTPINQNKKTPNIIFLMSESFWDPTKLKIGFSEDPMSNIMRMMDEYTSGQILSPSFGGGTANVEFEALTGFTNSFLDNGVMPYQDLVPSKPFIPTIVSDLENKGYKSLAIHPYNKVFYKRDLVYQTFGFDQFLDQETMKHTDRTRGGLITDESLTYEILDNIKKQKKPLFIHAVSMQNHMPYGGNNYEGFKIDVSGLKQESIWPLQVYSEGISRSDEALKLLVDNLEKIDEPTIVVFWGDHLPVLGADFAIYKEAGYFDKDPKVNDRKMYETPLLIYSNFNSPQNKLNDISPCYLGPIVYKMGGLKNPGLYNLLDQLKNEMPGIKGASRYGTDQKLITKLTKKQKQLLADYKMIEYDLLVGKQYSKDLLYPQKK